MKRVPIVVSRNYTISILKRVLAQPSPGKAEAKHTFEPVIEAVRSNVSTRGGVSEFASVDTNGQKATHTFDIRFTNVKFDVRNYVRDARGQLYKILAVENKNNEDRALLIHCSNQGDELVEAAR